MILKITLPDNSNVLCVPAVNAGAIVASLESAFSIQSEGWGDKQKWNKCQGNPSVEFISETALGEKPEPLKVALQNYEVANRNWLAEYTKRQEAEKERDELKAKLETIKQAQA